MQGVKKMDLDTLNPSQLIDEFDNDQPLPELYNVIYDRTYPDLKINRHGFAKTDS